jgi:hypothetical protein
MFHSDKDAALSFRRVIDITGTEVLVEKRGS